MRKPKCRIAESWRGNEGDHRELALNCHQFERNGEPAYTTEERRELEKSFRIEGLKEEGRLQFFFHSPDSALPIRDVVGRRKKEPHIEKNAENYCRECYQNNILAFLKSPEKYLFLFTKCESNAPELREYMGQRFIVGYIEKERWLWRGAHCAVQGPTKVVQFEDSYPLCNLGLRARYWRVRKLNTSETSDVLRHLAKGANIRNQCIQEIKRLEEGKPQVNG